MSTFLRVLVLEARLSDAELIVHELRRAGLAFDWRRADSRAGYLDQLGWPPDLILADCSLPQLDASQALTLLRERGLAIPFIILSAGFDEKALECMRQGASDYLLKDRLGRLGPAVMHALEKQQLETARGLELQQLRDSEVRYRDLLENANDIVFTHDFEERITWINRATEEVTGYSRQEALGLSLRDLLDPEDLRLARRDMRALLAGAPRSTHEVQLITRDGQRVPFEVSARLIMVNGQPVGIQGNARDVRERKQAEARLKASERKYRELVDFNLAGVYCTSLEGEILECNPALARMLGLDSVHKMKRLSVLAFYPEAADRQAFLDRLWKDGALTNHETQLRRLDGSLIWVSENATWVDDQASGERRILGTLIDVSGRKQAEAEAQKRLSQLETVRAISRAISNTLDLREVLRLFLEKVLRHSRFRACDILLHNESTGTLEYAGGIGFSTGALRHTSLRLGEGYAGRAAAENRVIIIESLREDSGPLSASSQLPLEGFGAYVGLPLPGRRGVVGVLELFRHGPGGVDKDDLEFLKLLAGQAAIAIDNATLYERLRQHSQELELAIRQATASLQEAKDRIEAILDNSPDAVLLLDLTGKIQLANQAVQTLFGCLPEELTGRPIQELFQPDARPLAMRSLTDLSTSKSVQRVCLTAQKQGGGGFDAELSLAPVQGESLTKSAVATVRDVTAWTDLQHMKDAFVSSVSHELRTPIASLRLNLELLRLNPAKGDVYMQRLDREICRLGELIEALLRLSRLDQGQVELHWEVVDPNAIVRQLVEDRIPLASAKQQELRLTLNPGAPAIRADPGLIGQALSALLTNALNYTPVGGRIEVRVVEHGQGHAAWAGFCVRDTGPGIPPEEAGQLFVRFFRGKAGRESGESGTGLGLGIAHEIVQRHGGRIEVQSIDKTGEGAEFTIWLPAAVAQGKPAAT
jgi:PAS domain S-box-containing protein